MLSTLRALSQTWFAKIFLVFLGFGLISFSFAGRFHPSFSDAVVQAGSHTVSQSLFGRVFDKYLDDYNKQNGQQISKQDAVGQGLDREILEGLEGDEASLELASRMGLRAAPAAITAELRKRPDFFDPISGKFSQQQFALAAKQMDFTPDQFITQLSDELSESQLMAGLAAGLKAPRIYGALIEDYGLEERSLSYVVLDPRTEPAPATPTDAQLVAFMKARHFSLPENRVLTVVKFDPAALAPTMPVDQAVVKQLYDAETNPDAPNTLWSPEKRSLVEIPTKDAASAALAVQRLRAGKDPNEVAKSLGLSAILYDNVVKGAVADPKVADAAFSLPAGPVSAPIHSDLTGYPVVKVTAIAPSSTPTLESLRPQLEAEARKRAATKKIFDAVQAFDAAHQSGANLADSAKKANFPTTTVGPINANGASMTGPATAGLSPKLLKEAFSLPLGGETDSEDDGQGGYFAVRVERVTPAGMPAVADIRGPLTQAYMSDQVLHALQAKADQLAARLRKGEAIASVAASAKLQVMQNTGVSRQKVNQYSAIGDNLLDQIFQSKAGDVIIGQTASSVIMIAHIDSVTPPAPGVAASGLISQESQTSQMLFGDVTDAQRNWAKRKVKPTYDLKQARSALGITDADLPPSPDAAPVPGKAP